MKTRNNSRFLLTAISALIFSVFMAKSLFAYYVETSYNWYYELVSYSGGARLINPGYYSLEYKGDVIIPLRVGNYPVTELGYELFADCEKLTSIVFPETLKEVGLAAFSGCTSMNNVAMNDGLLEIGSYAFQDCSSLSSIVIPDTVKAIDDSAFVGCSCLQEVHLPSEIESIGNGVFSECINLSNIFISEKNAYYKVNEGVLLTKDGKTFLGVTANRKSFLIPSLVTSIAPRTFYNYEKLNNLYIPSSVKTIGESAFMFCSDLANVNISTGMKEIEDEAFYYCNSLRKISLPASIERIGVNVFGGWGLRSFYIAEDNIKYRVENDTIVSMDGQRLISIPGGCTYVNLPYGIKDIPESAFYSSNTKEVCIPNSVTNIENEAFRSTELISLIIPDSVVSIGEDAFSFSTSLGSVVIGSSVRNLGKDSFYYMSDLTNVVFKGVPPEGLKQADISSSVTIYYPKENESEWTTALAQVGHTKFQAYNKLTDIIPEKVSRKYNIKLNPNGGVGSLTTIEFETEKIQNLPTNTFVKEGFSFEGWTTNQTRKIFFYDGEAVKNLVCNSGGEVELLAVWKPNEYMVSFDANGGEGHMDTFCCTNDVFASLPTNVFTRTGYTFVGWSLSPLGTVNYTNGESVINLSTLNDGVVKLYAVWKPNKYSILFHPNGGIGEMNPQVLKYDENANIFANNFEKSGYDFLGWSDRPDGEVVYVNESSISNLIEIDCGVINLYAVWQEGSILLPIITPNNGSVFLTSKCLVTISCESENATIYYSVDGTTPRQNPSFIYNGPFEIDSTVTVKAIAVKGALKSPYVSATITQQLTTIAQAVDAPELKFVTGGTSSWIPVFDQTAIYNGISVRSGAMKSPNRGFVESWVQVEVNGAGELSFWWKVDCEKDDSGDVTWDRLMCYVDNLESDIIRIDGRTEWERKVIKFNSPGLHIVKWVYLKDNYDEPNADNADCAWLDGIVWRPLLEVIPELDESATAEQVANVLREFTDGSLVTKITTVAEYATYRAWVLGLKGVTPDEVKVSPNAWLSYALDTDVLIVAAPREGGVVIDTFEIAATEGAFEFTVKIDGIEVGDSALEANLRKVFDVEGAETLASGEGGFSSDNVELNIATPVNGNVKFIVTPKMGNGEKSESFFFRVKMK